MKSVYEVAKIFGVHFQTVRKWIYSGKMKAVKVGRIVRVDDSEIERFKKEYMEVK